VQASTPQGSQRSGPPNIWPAWVHQCVGLPVTATKSRVLNALFYFSSIDCVVVAFVEQVYSGPVTCCRDTAYSEGAITQSERYKISISTLKCFIILPQNAPKCVWWPGSARTCWEAYRPLAGLKERRGREGRRERGRNGKDPNVWNALTPPGLAEIHTTDHGFMVRQRSLLWAWPWKHVNVNCLWQSCGHCYDLEIQITSGSEIIVSADAENETISTH